MGRDRHFAEIARQMKGQDGQALQQFMSNSPWSANGVVQQIQAEIGNRSELANGSRLILDERADEKSGIESAESLRLYNRRMGKMDESQV
jgi:SRSO17 transposase